MSAYWQEFLTIAVVHLLAVASPGPDFAIVLRHAIRFGRYTAVITSLGIGVGILLHVAYSLMGIAILIETTPWLFSLLTYLAALYLGYIGIQAIQAKKGQYSASAETTQRLGMSTRRAFWTGFLTNGLNPKATLFFLSLFALIIAPQTPQTIKIGYGLYLACATAAWFCLLSWGLGSLRVRRFIGEQGHWVDRAMGAVLIGLAIQLVVSDLG